MIRVLPILAALALAVYCLVECLQTDGRLVRYLPKALWLFLILIPIAGPLAWLFAGRPRRSGPTGRARPVTPRRPPGPRAPDDDPEFLAGLDEERRRAARDPKALDPTARDTRPGDPTDPRDADAGDTHEGPESRGDSGP